MRRDVRLLGDLLGEVLRESGGQDLLDDVEQLRHAVIDARLAGAAAARTAAALDEIAAMVAAWPLDRAEASRARSPSTSTWPTWPRNITGSGRCGSGTRATSRARVAGRRGRQSSAPNRRAPARRPARPAAGAPGADRAPDRGPPPRGGHRAAPHQPTSSTAWTTTRHGAASGPRPGAGCARRSTCSGAPRRCGSGHRPARRGAHRDGRLRRDAVPRGARPSTARWTTRWASAAAAGRPGAGGPAFLRFGSWIGGDRDGNPFVTAEITSEAAVIQAEHVLRALENATTRIGRALTLHAETAPPARALGRALEARRAAHPDLLAGAWPALAAASRTGVPALRAQRLRATRPAPRRPRLPAAAEFLADLRLVQDALAEAGAPGRRSASCST